MTDCNEGDNHDWQFYGAVENRPEADVLSSRLKIVCVMHHFRGCTRCGAIEEFNPVNKTWYSICN